MPRLVLASASPRRAELLSWAGLSFSVAPAAIKEAADEGETAGEMVLRLARTKAEALLEANCAEDDVVILAADTTVALCHSEREHKILEKPSDRENAVSMLSLLQGREHLVTTAVAISCKSKETISFAVETYLTVKSMSAQEIEAYIALDEWKGKAGGYALQGRGSEFVIKVRGSYSNVVGLPLVETLGALEGYDVYPR